jgi:hypothetical protein
METNEVYIPVLLHLSPLPLPKGDRRNKLAPYFVSICAGTGLKSRVPGGNDFIIFHIAARATNTRKYFRRNGKGCSNFFFLTPDFLS